MFQSAMAAGLRHLWRGKLYAAIAVCGLALGICAALLAALHVRSQYSFDRFIPGYQDVYLTTLGIRPSQRVAFYLPETPGQVAGALKQRFPGISSVTRLALEEMVFRVDQVERRGWAHSVDPNLFDTLPLSVIAGDAVAALARADQVILTRSEARSLFGEDAPLGRIVEAQLQDGSRHPLTVGAIIGDIPLNRSQLRAGIFISGHTSWTRLGVLDRRTGPVRGLFSEVRTMVRLYPGTSPLPMQQDLQKVLPELIDQFRQQQGDQGDADEGAPELSLVRIDRINVEPRMNQGVVGRLLLVAMLGLVVLAVSVVNFVNLLTARSDTRSMEVGVRKLAGARRGSLTVQFLGESLVHVGVALLLAVALAELLLPHLNAFLDADAQFAYWKEPALLGWLLLAAVGVGLLAGFWPALVLSALRPLRAMRGAGRVAGAGRPLRQVLVTLQFALLIGLVFGGAVVHLQQRYATAASQRFDTEQMLILEMKCSASRLDQLRALAGVRDAACADAPLIGDGWSTSDGKTREGEPITFNMAWVDDRVLSLYGISPLAGRNLAATDFDPASGRSSTRYLINETAMRRLGFESAQAAIGPYPLTSELQEIIGVLPDFSMGPVDQPIWPTVFYADPNNFSRMYVKLKGQDVPATLESIDGVWRETGGTGPLDRYFFEERVQRMYESMRREARAVTIISGVAVLLACLGLLGLAAAVAQQRTREIGLRKALGATTGDVLILLLWQFSKPVVWANLLAWPVAGWVMHRWLSGFAFHVDLPLWLFPVIGIGALAVALCTVGVHALLMAQARPVVALRHQ